MGNKVDCFSTHLIDNNGTFNGVGLDNFIEKVKMEKCGLSYVVVSIIGPQMGGKSTLLNNLFHTNFREMDACNGRSQTTKGIWIARCVDIEPCTIVMDLEGTDGKERGENTVFEKQSALFALAVSDVVLFNMWCHDIGRENAANTPLLKTIFQVMLKLPISPRKTTFMIVIRDKSVTPLEKLEHTLREDIQKIWDSVPKPEAHKNTLLSEYLNVQVVALSSYEYQKEEFEEQVASLRHEFCQSTAPGGLAGDRKRLVPASRFSCCAQEIWEIIKQNKDLDLPSNKVLTAIIRCEQIANEKYFSFLDNEDWRNLEEAVKSHRVQGFGQMLSSLLCNCLSSYDKEATDYEENVRYVKRKGLEKALLELVQPAYDLMLEHIQSVTLEGFKKTLNYALNGKCGFALVARECTISYMKIFDENCQDAVIEQANWNLAGIRDNFSRNIDAHVTEVKTAQLSDLATLYKERLNELVFCSLEDLLKDGSDDTWPRIRKLVSRKTSSVISEFEHSGFEMDEQAKEMKSDLINYARRLVEGETRQQVKIASSLLKERFISAFNYDEDSKPRSWTGNDDIPAITKTARLSCLKLLSVLAAIRLDEDETDTIWDTLVHAIDDPERTQTLLDSDTWENVPDTNTLLTPSECKSLWDTFLEDTNDTIIQANASQKANKKKKYIKYVAIGVGGTAALAVAGTAAVGIAGTVAASEVVGTVAACVSSEAARRFAFRSAATVGLGIAYHILGDKFTNQFTQSI